MEEHQSVFATGFIPKDCVNGDTQIEMDHSTAQALSQTIKTNVISPGRVCS